MTQARKRKAPARPATTRETLLVEIHDWIGAVTLNRPDRLNAINFQMAQELNSALVELGADDAVRVIVIKGAGRCFCAGMDLSEFGDLSAIDFFKLLPVLEETTRTIPELPKPVIGQVHSFCLAGGNELALACDLVIASEDASFGTTAINFGGFCFAPSVLLSRHTGRKKALEMLLTGDRMEAKEAYRLGLINRVVPLEKLEEAAAELSARIAAKSPLAVRLGKKAFYSGGDMTFEHALHYAHALNAVLSSTEDSKEGFNSFREKRSPQWKGR
ncbi:MAG: enoyl-CoA hydratase/isomerase family protein [Chloroflexi bacterium]|nr:enoyl-CoA hydratase/isomerase family protein [Chloroflexota bacterium]